MLQIIVRNRKEIIIVDNFREDRLELVSAMREGRLTPSYGAIKQVLRNVSNSVQVIIRPHSYYNYGNPIWKLLRMILKKF